MEKNSMNNRILALICAAFVCSLGLLTGCDDPFKDPKVDDEIKVEPVLPAAALPGTIINSIVAGGSQLFTANFSGDVTWTVVSLKRDTNNNNAWTTTGAIQKQTNTTMNTWGLLTVSLDEQAEGLRVMAKNKDGKEGSYDLARLPSSQTMSDVVAELSEYISSRGSYTVINVTDTGIEIPYSTTIKVPTGQTLTIPKGVTVTFRNESTDVSSGTSAGNVFNGDVIVRGTLVIEDGVAASPVKKYAEATGTGTITVEDGGVYTEATSAYGRTAVAGDVFKFFRFGKTVVKYGGTLKANKWLWEGGTVEATPKTDIPAFIGADVNSVIRPSVGGEVVINKYNTTNTAYDYELTGPVVINEGKTWALAAKDTIKIGVYDPTVPTEAEKLKPATLTVARRAQLDAKLSGVSTTITMVDGSSIDTQGSGEVYVGGDLKLGDGKNSFYAKVADNGYPIVLGTTSGKSTVTLNNNIPTTAKTPKGYVLFLLGAGNDTANVLSLQAQEQTASTVSTVFIFSKSGATPAKPVVLAAGTEAITIPSGSSTTNGAILEVPAKGSIDFGTGGNGILLEYVDASVARNGTLKFAIGATLGTFKEAPGAAAYTSEKKLDTVAFSGGTFASMSDKVLTASSGQSVTPLVEDQKLSAATTLE
jgi:hypothetical protein